MVFPPLLLTSIVPQVTSGWPGRSVDLKGYAEAVPTTNCLSGAATAYPCAEAAAVREAPGDSSSPDNIDGGHFLMRVQTGLSAKRKFNRALDARAGRAAEGVRQYTDELEYSAIRREEAVCKRPEV